MNKLLLSFMIVNSTVFAMDTTIQMPEREELQKRLDEIGMTHFAEKTEILDQLAGQEKAALGVAMAVELSIHDYLEYLEKGMPKQAFKTMQAIFLMNKPLLLETLLKDHPQALRELRSQGLYTGSCGASKGIPMGNL